MRALTMLAANRYVAWNGTEERVTVRPEPADVPRGRAFELSVTRATSPLSLSAGR
jgi:hypothetical protein